MTDKRIFKPNKWTCTSCEDVIQSSYSGEFVTCGCGKTSIDETAYYCRMIGQPPKEFFNEDNRMVSTNSGSRISRAASYVMGIFCRCGRLLGF